MYFQFLYVKSNLEVKRTYSLLKKYKMYYMKNILKIISLIGITSGVIASCTSDELLMYNQEKPGVYFYQIGATANGPLEGTFGVDYNFITEPASKTKDTLTEELLLRIMGVAVNYDREINIVLEDSSSAVQGVHFDLPDPVIMPANTYEVYIPVYLYRTDDLQTDTKTIYLTIEESNDFDTGYDANLQHYITVTDQLTQPSDWPGFISDSYYGTYSKVKHEFIVQTLGTIRITMATGSSISQIMSFYQKLILALSRYEAANGPLLDENGVRVTFP